MDVGQEPSGLLHSEVGYDPNGYSKYLSKEYVGEDGRRIARLRKGTLSDLQLITLPDHTQALNEYIRLLTPTHRPVYIFDHHTPALFAWSEALAQKRIQKGAMLLHFDTHADDAFEINLPGVDPATVAQILPKLSIADFIAPAIDAGIISKFIWISPDFTKNEHEEHVRLRGSAALINISIESTELFEILETTDPSHLICDGDVDFFTDFKRNPQMITRFRKFSDIKSLLRHDLSIIKKAINKSGVTTIATSPKFIDQPFALQLVHQLLR